MFLKMIEWHTGVLTNFTSSSGQSGRNIKHYLPESLYNKILSTYPDSEPGNIWKSVFAMTEIFGDLAEKVAESMNFYYNNEEELNVKEYLGSVYETVTAS
jgi:aminoglycoside 6-adenylyltransferase